MYHQIMGLRVASVVFALVCLAQLLRLALQPEVQVAGYTVPLWPSAVAVIISGGLSCWMWTLSRRAIR
ncbi:MAG TPA: hypothetical protein VGH74_05950 [Planctomycetaceae bacterium]|jgi:hypothetical protein